MAGSQQMFSDRNEQERGTFEPKRLGFLDLVIPGTRLTSVLIGKDHILGGWWSKREVIQVVWRIKLAKPLVSCLVSGFGLAKSLSDSVRRTLYLRTPRWFVGSQRRKGFRLEADG